jgi:hypothetical protein
MDDLGPSVMGRPRLPIEWPPGVRPGSHQRLPLIAGRRGSVQSEDFALGQTGGQLAT